MKIKSNYLLREVAGNTVVVPVGERAIDFNGIITLNGTAAFLWQTLQDDKTEAELLQAMLDKYEIDEDRAKQDLALFLETLRTNKFLDD